MHLKAVAGSASLGWLSILVRLIKILKKTQKMNDPHLLLCNVEPVAFLAGKVGKYKTICALIAHADYFPPKFSSYGF